MRSTTDITCKGLLVKQFCELLNRYGGARLWWVSILSIAFSFKVLGLVQGADCPTGEQSHWPPVLESHKQRYMALECMRHFLPFPQPKKMTWSRVVTYRIDRGRQKK